MSIDQFLRKTYKPVMKLTRHRGEHTLAKVDCILFKNNRKVFFDSKNSIFIYLPPDPHFFKYLIKTHEEHIRIAISRLAKPGNIVIDIGANVGYFAAHAAMAVGKEGSVLCLEPEESNFAVLQSNCDALERSGFNCKAYQLAASDSEGDAVLNLHRHSTYHSIDDADCHLDRVEGQAVVKKITLDKFAESQGLKHISLLKVDTEGHEAKVLEGSRRLFNSRMVDYTILECRSDRLAEYIDKFAEEYSLNQLAWDGSTWRESKLRSLRYKTECLLSLNPVPPTLLC